MEFQLNVRDEMTPSERLAAIRKGRDFDRVPVYMFLGDIKARFTGKSVEAYYKSTESLIEGEIRAFNMFGMDDVGVGPNAMAIAEAAGVKTRFQSNGHREIVEHKITSPEEAAYLSPLTMEMGELKKYYEIAARLREKADGIVPVTVYLIGPVTLAGYICGMEKFFLSLIKNPEGAHILLQYAAECMKAVTDGFADLDVEYYFADPVASISMMSPRMYKKFAYPYTLEICRHITEKTGKKATYHVCGETEKAWPYIKKLPLECFSIDNAMDLEKACRYFSDTMKVAGNVPPVDVIYRGNREMIYESVGKCLDAGKVCKAGFVLAPGCNIPMPASDENMHYYMEAARDLS